MSGHYPPERVTDACGLDLFGPAQENGRHLSTETAKRFNEALNGNPKQRESSEQLLARALDELSWDGDAYSLGWRDGFRFAWVMVCILSGAITFIWLLVSWLR